MSSARNGRFALALTALFALTLLAAGCGGDGEDSGAGGTTATATTSESDGGPGAGAKGGGGASIERPAGSGGEGAPPTALKEAREFGSEASDSEAEEVEAALTGYLEAQAGGEWSQACSYLAKELRRLEARLAHSVRGGGEGCPGFVAATTERLSPSERSGLADVDVQSVRIEGKSGYILYIDGSGAETAKPILDEAGRWKLSSLLASLLQKGRSRESP